MARSLFLIALLLAASACTSIQKRNDNAMFGAIAQHMKDTRR